MLTHGSLFSGIGGFDLGFERAGIKTIWQVEINPHCQRVLAKHFPAAVRHGDIKTCGKHNLSPVDIITAGFPCQPTSLAGKRLAQDDERWLWPECCRIICELRPRCAVLENPPGLLSLGMGDVLGDLAACGYDAEWTSVLAADLGAPHLRERIWFVAYPMRDRYEQPAGADATAFDQKRNDPPYRKERRAITDSPEPSGEDVADSDSPRESQPQGREQELRQWPSDSGALISDSMRKRLPERDEQRSVAAQRSRIIQRSELVGVRSTIGRKQWEIEPDVGRVADGIPNRVDRLRGLGNAIIPQIAEWIGKQVKEALESNREA